MVYKFFYKKFAGSGVNMQANKSDFNTENLAEGLHKPIIRKLKKRTIYSGFKDNIWGAEYAWLVPLKDKKKCKDC